MSRFTVNNEPIEYKLDPETPLLWALRDASNLTGTKYGCGTGHCGACTVDIDGRAMRRANAIIRCSWPSSPRTSRNAASASPA
jgi:aerobic-type carbon monoxide dehydrogenase small subunit (CoxS/CutS family)